MHTIEAMGASPSWQQKVLSSLSIMFLSLSLSLWRHLWAQIFLFLSTASIHIHQIIQSLFLSKPTYNMNSWWRKSVAWPELHCGEVRIERNTYNFWDAKEMEDTPPSLSNHHPKILIGTILSFRSLSKSINGVQLIKNNSTKIPTWNFSPKC